MMRKVIFYGMIVAQVSVIVLLAWQLQASLSKGTELTLMIKPDESEDIHAYDLTADYYAQFDINYITKEQMEGDPSLNDVIYVLLRKGKDAYEVKQASTKKLTPDKDEIVLTGTYIYDDENKQAHYIEYGFEHIKNIEKYGDYTNQDKLEVTLTHTKKWNQYRVVDVQQAK